MKHVTAGGRLQVDDGTSLAAIDRVEARAVGADTARHLAGRIAGRRLDRDATVRVFVLRGAGGKALVAGTDISQFQTFRGADAGVKYERRIDEVLGRLERVAKPTIAQVEGVAAGGGCAIAVTCDLRVATPASTFGIPIARTPGNCLSGATYSRPLDLLGPAAGKDLLFNGRLLHAPEAYP